LPLRAEIPGERCPNVAQRDDQLVAFIFCPIKDFQFV